MIKTYDIIENLDYHFNNLEMDSLMYSETNVILPNIIELTLEEIDSEGNLVENKYKITVELVE